MNWFKQHLLMTFFASIVMLSLAFGITGYLLSTNISDAQPDTSHFPWSVSPDAGYTLIEETAEGNHFTAIKADGSKVCIDGEGQPVKTCKSGHRFANGLCEFVQDGSSGLKDASGKVVAAPNIYYFEDCGEYLIAFYDTDEGWRNAALYDGSGKALINEKSYCYLNSIGDDWFFAECDNNYVYNARTGEKHFVDDEMFLVYTDGQGGFYGETGPIVEIYPLDEAFQLQKDGISFGHMSAPSEGLRYVQINQPETPMEEIHAYINAENEVVIDLREEDGSIPKMASPFSEGKAFIQSGKKLICIDKSGKHLFELDVTSEDYTIEETAFHEGYAALSLDDDSFDLFDSKKHYGYIDESGDYVLPPTLYAAGSVRHGYAIAATGAEQYGILKFD